MSTATTRVFRLPDLGEGLTEAGLVHWLVAVGDTIGTDQPIAEVETAKSIVELPSPFAGVVLALHGEPGDTIDVGAPVLEVGDEDTSSAPDAGSPDAGSSDPHEAYRTEERAGAGSGSGNVLIGYGTTERAGSGRRRARLSRAAASRPDANVSNTNASNVPRPAAPGHRTIAVRSPIVRRLARELGVDLRALVPTGSDGAITRADVLRASEVSAGTSPDNTVRTSESMSGSTSVSSAAGASAEVIEGLAVASRERMSPLRKAVSATLSRSRSEIPEATVWVDVDATRLWRLRGRIAAEGGHGPSLTALIARFTLIALSEFPLLAGRLSGDATEMLTFDGVNLGVATDTARGLMVPVLPRAHGLTVDELDAALRELAGAARSGTLPPERLRGSTFTLNNYGSLGVDGSAAIINHPEVAILGIGRIIERPWVVKGRIVPRRIVQLSLVFDHRVCDGGYAAGFLRRVVELIEHPLRAYGRL
ncbi:pyruvate dehydrogenase E2 component (dihydrolipoamide acetyltransferase) [Microbacterium resistens]|uniref:Dihydrolipoamide acetyltransferase component of pyruvate dehydrogenase complex n=1 Tax=Microbacterium resistens TaxID=156977 RepID=A0ABU1SB90_9MICO|nr:dihydrolipoamide acetyltransferase family protein [Microbacterium resistens]MDR6866198.1 pyruvate dehydrogenase E2 component (dihydrolipoamide acetyltransferase) [Microbacterium resistens]